MSGREFDAYHYLAFGMYRLVPTADREQQPEVRPVLDRLAQVLDDAVQASKLHTATVHAYLQVAGRFVAFAEAKGLPLDGAGLDGTVAAYRDAVAAGAWESPASDRAAVRAVAGWLRQALER